MTSFVVWAVFNYLNTHLEYGKGKLTVIHFLYYFQPTRSSENNRSHPAVKSLSFLLERARGKLTKAMGWSSLISWSNTSTTNGGLLGDPLGHPRYST